MEKSIINVLSFMFVMLGYVIFGYEPVMLLLLFLIYVRLS